MIKPHINPDWPKCHFKTMTLHSSCSDLSGNSDGFACDHCGHELSLVDWIAKHPANPLNKRKQGATDAINT